VSRPALRKLRFSTNHSGHKRASGSRLRSARGLGQPRNSASGSHVLVTRCVWWLPDQEFTLSLPFFDSQPALAAAGSGQRRAAIDPHAVDGALRSARRHGSSAHRQELTTDASELLVSQPPTQTLLLRVQS
jgi:hypothetical protein